MLNQNTVIEQLAEKVMLRLKEAASPMCGVFGNMNEAVEACWAAQKKLAALSLGKRGEIIAAIREAAARHAEEVSELAVAETQMGNREHKIIKNKLAAAKSPGLEDLQSESFTGDNGLTLIELSPYGVIGAITPTTNPTETIICNSIGMIAAGNGVVFSPHPTAKNVSLRMVEIIHKAITEAGGPQNLITTVNTPSLEQAGLMIAHPKVNMLVATGGSAVVKAVLSSGKKAIGAGAGNPPALIDETADIEKAAKDVIDGCSFDNNLPCIAEKEIIVVERVADYLIFCMKGSGAFFIEDEQTLRRLEELLTPGNTVNKEYIGKSARHILGAIGITCGDDVKVISAEVQLSHPFVQHELMMPVLPVVRVKNIEEGYAAALQAEHAFRHTAIMHSQNVGRLSEFAKAVQTTIFVKNGPSYAGIGVGGEGYTTFTIAGPTGEGLTSAKSFARRRRCVLVDSFNIK